MTARQPTVTRNAAPESAGPSPVEAALSAIDGVDHLALRAARVRAGLDTQAMAEWLNMALLERRGLKRKYTRSVVSDFETGRRRIPQAVAEVLMLSPPPVAETPGEDSPVRVLRLARRQSRAEIAEWLTNALGHPISERAVRAWENGERSTPDDVAAAIREAFLPHEHRPA